MSTTGHTKQHDRMLPARSSQEREAFVVEVWNRENADERVGSYATLRDSMEPGDFPESVWPYRFAMIVSAHRGDEAAFVLNCFRDWDQMMKTTVARMALDDSEYPQYALDMDTGEYWVAEMDITLRRAA